VPRKRLVRELGDPMPAFVPSKPGRSFLIDQAASDRNRVDALEMQLARAKTQQMAARTAFEHRGLMAPSRGSDRLFRLLTHQKDEKKALAMASADFATPPHGDEQESRSAARADPSNVLTDEPHFVQSENAAQASARDDHSQGLGALDVVQEQDENVVGSLGGEEDFDEMNRDGSLRGASNDRNAMGSLFAVHAPSRAEEAEEEKARPESEKSFRYRKGHWSHDGLLWIVGDGEGPRFRTQQSLKSGLANTAHGNDAAGGEDAGTAATSAVAGGSAKAAVAAAAQPVVATADAPAAVKSVLAKTAAHAARASRQRKAAADSSSTTLSTGPLSLKRLLKDFGQYESEFGAFFHDDAHAKRHPRFAHAPFKG